MGTIKRRMRNPTLLEQGIIHQTQALQQAHLGVLKCVTGLECSLIPRLPCPAANTCSTKSVVISISCSDWIVRYGFRLTYIQLAIACIRDAAETRQTADEQSYLYIVYNIGTSIGPETKLLRDGCNNIIGLAGSTYTKTIGNKHACTSTGPNHHPTSCRSNNHFIYV